MPPTYSRAYLSTQVRTSDRAELVISLYETAIFKVDRAIQALADKNPGKRSEAIVRAAKILLTLGEALDLSQTDGPAGKLQAIYNYQIRCLLQANRTGETEPLEVVRGTLSMLLDGWRQAAHSPEAAEIRKNEIIGASTASLSSTRAR